MKYALQIQNWKNIKLIVWVNVTWRICALFLDILKFIVMSRMNSWIYIHMNVSYDNNIKWMQVLCHLYFFCIFDSILVLFKTNTYLYDIFILVQKTISNKVIYCCILKRSNKTENKREESSSFYSLRVTLYFQGQKAFKEDASKTRFERFPSNEIRRLK